MKPKKRKHERKFVTEIKAADKEQDLTAFCEIIAEAIRKGFER